MEVPDYIFQVEHVSRSFGDKEVLHDVCLNVKRGEFVTILGPSGCGKTTLLRILAGFTAPSAGVVRMAGHDITAMPPYRRPMNTVFQRYALFPHLNVYDNIAFGLKLRKRPEAEIERQVGRALKMVGMTDYEDRDVNSLSGGQQQRVAIARAIVNQPQVLLLDEPLSALDLKMRKDMQMELKEMHRSLGITFVYVTHDQEEALTLSDTIVVMNEGVIQQIGTPTDVYNEPVNSFVADFIGESNIIDGTMLRDYEVCFMGRDFKCVDKGFAQGEAVEVVIRPEDVYMVPNPDDGLFRGVVKSCTFKGVHYEMFVDTPEGYEIQVQDYNAFEVGKEVGMIVRPDDLHVMKAQCRCNEFAASIVDDTHVAMLGATFECTPHAFSKGTAVVAEVDCRRVDLLDNREDGIASGIIRSILYKGDHYRLTVDTDDGTRVFVDTDDVWEDYDLLGINIRPEDICLRASDGD